MKNPLRLAGKLNWLEFRELIINELEKCRTEHEFEVLLSKLWSAVGTIEEMQKKRKILGIKKLTKEEIKELESTDKIGPEEGKDI